MQIYRAYACELLTNATIFQKKRMFLEQNRVWGIDDRV